MGSTSPLHTLRRSLIEKRKALSPTEVLIASEKLSQTLLNHALFKSSQHIAVYLPHQNEISLENLIKKAWELHKNLYLPILHPYHPGYLFFGLYTPDTRLVVNIYGILEPEYKISEIVAAWELDLVLMPLVGFDEQNNRIGMGKGYYDRTFQFKTFTQSPTLIGCAFAWQQVSSITSQPWDIPLDAVVTD